MKRYVIDSYLVALAKHAYEYPLFWFCRNRSRMDSTWNGLEHTSKKNIDSESLGGGVKGGVSPPLAERGGTPREEPRAGDGVPLLSCTKATFL